MRKKILLYAFSTWIHGLAGIVSMLLALFFVCSMGGMKVSKLKVAFWVCMLIFAIYLMDRVNLI